jgi:hypothetical protein
MAESINGNLVVCGHKTGSNFYSFREELLAHTNSQTELALKIHERELVL